MMKIILKFYKYFVIAGFLLFVVDKIYTERVDYVFSTESSFINGYEIVGKNSFKESFINYLYKNIDDDYISKIHDYNSKEELSVTDLIKEDCLDKYYNKIKELLYLKYPEFIASELSKNYGKNSYFFKDNELVIYFNDYNLEVSEILFLKVNYNEIYKYLNFSVLLDKTYKNESGYDYSKDKMSVAFTFDDSPNNGNTQRIVDALRKNYSKATFFMLGSKMGSNKELVRFVYDTKNEIGSHSYSHKNNRLLTTEEIINDHDMVNNIYKEIIGSDILLFRPPYGIIKDESFNSLNVSYILWSMDTLDWKYRSKDHVINHVLNNINDGDIILLHDTYDSTVEAVEELLPILYSKGYQVVSVSELAKIKNKSLEVKQIYRNIK